MDREQLFENWFSGDHDADDFIRADRLGAYSVIAPLKKSSTVFYFTKTSVAFAAARELSTPIDFGLIARGGLPDQSDVDWLVNTIGSREVRFVGDLDPADIMIYAWLRERLSPVQVTHFGINDQFLDRLNVEVPETYRIRLSSPEIAAVASIAKTFDDVYESLGGKCVKVLADGYKIELEAVVTSLSAASPLLKHAH